MDFSDFPNYFQAASNAVVKYQRYYSAIKQSVVVLLILAMVVILYSFLRSDNFLIANGVITALLVLSCFLTVLLLTKKYDQIAQESLSFKESCKTATWQFIMNVGEFNRPAGVDELQEAFANRMQQIIDDYQDLIPYLDVASVNQDLLTSKMLEFRDASFEEKKQYYTQQRIGSLYEQYFTKAYKYHETYRLWFLNTIMSQVFAIAASGFLILSYNEEWSVIAVVTMLGSSIVSWFGLQKNLEKKQHYSLATRELYVIQEALELINLESELADFVRDTEKVLSGPNAFWLIPGAAKVREEVLV